MSEDSASPFDRGYAINKWADTCLKKKNECMLHIHLADVNTAHVMFEFTARGKPVGERIEAQGEKEAVDVLNRVYATAHARKRRWSKAQHSISLASGDDVVSFSKLGFFEKPAHFAAEQAVKASVEHAHDLFVDQNASAAAGIGRLSVAANRARASTAQSTAPAQAAIDNGTPGSSLLPTRSETVEPSSPGPRNFDTVVTSVPEVSQRQAAREPAPAVAPKQQSTAAPLRSQEIPRPAARIAVTDPSAQPVHRTVVPAPTSRESLTSKTSAPTTPTRGNGGQQRAPVSNGGSSAGSVPSGNGLAPPPLPPRPSPNHFRNVRERQGAASPSDSNDPSPQATGNATTTTTAIPANQHVIPPKPVDKGIRSEPPRAVAPPRAAFPGGRHASYQGPQLGYYGDQPAAPRGVSDASRHQHAPHRNVQPTQPAHHRHPHGVAARGGHRQAARGGPAIQQGRFPIQHHGAYHGGGHRRHGYR